MKLLKLLSLTIFMALFSHCSTTKKMQDNQLVKEAPFQLDKISYQHWVAGVRGGGSGVNLFIPVTSNQTGVVLDSAYFRGMTTKIVKENTDYFARFKKQGNSEKDLIMSTTPKAEYGNKLPDNQTTFPFVLKDNECVISYIENNETKYVKISDLVEIKRQEFPSAPHRQ
jgi:hypothetical protein